MCHHKTYNTKNNHTIYFYDKNEFRALHFHLGFLKSPFLEQNRAFSGFSQTKL